jgi:hypothetical protein
VKQSWKKELHALKKYMAEFAPVEEIIADGESHFYDIIDNGKPREAFYLAVKYPCGRKGARLICSFGFTDGRVNYYSSLKEKIILLEKEIDELCVYLDIRSDT